MTVKTSQAEYLVGEPIFVIADVKNVGLRPVAYSRFDGHVDLIVAGAPKKQAPNLSGCFGGFGRGQGGGVYDSERLMRPGEVASAWYLLKGYRLRAGDYVLHASGTAGVRWQTYFFVSDPSITAPPPRGQSENDPIEGQMFDIDLKLTVEKGTEAELKTRYARYIADAESGDPERRARARGAIAEMAPTFLEKTILEFATQPQSEDLAVEGLGQILTPESRADLVDLFGKTADLRLRALIVEKLAGIGTATELAFFSSLLEGRSTVLDDHIRKFAALGLGRLGGEDAVKALQSAHQSPNPEVRVVIATALGNTNHAAAIPVLIGMYSDEAAAVRNSVCNALMTLTHYRWCEGADSVTAAQAKWRDWWRSHAFFMTLYGPGQCPGFGVPLPSVK